MKERPVRKHIRLKGYDYSNAGYYFVTICVQDGHELLWAEEPVVGAAFGRPALSKAGLLIDAEIKKIESIYSCVRIDNYVIMPNHVHMMIRLSTNRDMDRRVPVREMGGRPKAAPTISRIVNQFKGSVSKQLGYSIWQKLFHDYIIRNEADYQRIWQYIDNNPATWTQDDNYVAKEKV